jgi:hypothetical protein
MEMRFLSLFLFMNCLERKYCQKIIKKNNLKGIYKISNLFNNNNLGIDKNDNVLFWNKNSYFNIYKIEQNSNKYLIESNNNNKFLGIDKQRNISIYKEQEVLNKEKIIWEIINIKKNIFFIKNIYNNKYLEANKNRLQCLNENIFISNKVDNNEKVNKKYINLYKLEKFGVSKNFIYIEDDFFIGKPLKKNDFFYYDKNKKKFYHFYLQLISRN